MSNFCFLLANALRRIAGLGLLLGYGVSLQAQFAPEGEPVWPPSAADKAAAMSGLPKRDLGLKLEPVSFTETQVVLGCRINFRALVEVNVYDLDTNSVMATSALLPPGAHRIPVKRDQLLPGYRYLYSFYYKGKKYFGEFKN